MLRTLRTILHIIPVLVFVIGCDDDPSNPGGGTGRQAPLSGHVTMLYDSVAVVGAKVVLVDALPYRIIAGPVITDTDGYFAFDNPPRGDWYLFVFADGRLMMDAADARVSIQRISPVTRDIEMIASDLWGGGNRFIAGRVTDATTGDPIEGAYVSSFFWTVWHNFAGIVIDAEDVTDAGGRYQVAPINLMIDTSTFRIINPVGVSKEGYAPFYMMDVPIPDVDTTYVLDVALERMGSGATLRGRIVSEGGPVPGLPVGLDFVGIPLDTLTVNNVSKSGGEARRVPLLGSAVRTDATGRFRIEDLAPGTYFIDAGYLADDGYVAFYDEATQVEIHGDEVVDAGDIRVIPALLPISPPNGAVLHDTRPVLQWEAVPGADRYHLSAGAGHSLSFDRDIVGATEFQFESDIPVGLHVRWLITAYRSATPYDEEIAKFETLPTFSVAE